jgi:hypothetical protein
MPVEEVAPMMGLIEEEIILALQTLLAVLMVAARRLQSPMMLPSNSGRCLSSRTVENLRQRGRPLACLRALALLLPQPPYRWLLRPLLPLTIALHGPWQC